MPKQQPKLPRPYLSDYCLQVVWLIYQIFQHVLKWHSRGVITGRAIYDGRLDLGEAIALTGNKGTA